MNWYEIALLVAGVLGFMAAGAFIALRVWKNPLILFELVPTLWRAAKPHLVKLALVLFARMSPELEKQMIDCERRGGKWDNFRKKCVERR